MMMMASNAKMTDRRYDGENLFCMKNNKERENLTRKGNN